MGDLIVGEGDLTVGEGDMFCDVEGVTSDLVVVQVEDRAAFLVYLRAFRQSTSR